MPARPTMDRPTRVSRIAGRIHWLAMQTPTSLTAPSCQPCTSHVFLYCNLRAKILAAGLKQSKTQERRSPSRSRSCIAKDNAAKNIFYFLPSLEPQRLAIVRILPRQLSPVRDRQEVCKNTFPAMSSFCPLGYCAESDVWRDCDFKNDRIKSND